VWRLAIAFSLYGKTFIGGCETYGTHGGDSPALGGWIDQIITAPRPTWARPVPSRIRATRPGALQARADAVKHLDGIDAPGGDPMRGDDAADRQRD
jgi:hypothetical protein